MTTHNTHTEKYASPLLLLAAGTAVGAILGLDSLLSGSEPRLAVALLLFVEWRIAVRLQPLAPKLPLAAIALGCALLFPFIAIAPHLGGSLYVKICASLACLALLLRLVLWSRLCLHCGQDPQIHREAASSSLILSIACAALLLLCGWSILQGATGRPEALFGSRALVSATADFALVFGISPALLLLRSRQALLEAATPPAAS